MVTILENQSLKKLNTFGIDAAARKFVKIKELADIEELISAGLLQKEPYLILGGGSNMLFLGDYEGVVLKLENKGIDILSETADEIIVKVSAGEEWHSFVIWCVERGYWGVENLSLIPGNVGSCPIQNIGAYGVEVKDTIYSVQTIDLQSGELKTIQASECNFGYRDSIFKHELKNKVMIWTVVFRLNKKANPKTGYGAITQELNSMGVTDPGISDISQAVCNIRRSKLPDPEVIGNAGSFFKNPTVPADKAELLRASYPGMPAYLLADQNVKLAAGWLIEQCNWKGFRRGDAGVHEKQALCLVNYGNANGSDILQLAEDIRQSVLERFDVLLEMEVNIIA